jgi:signal transduction histidine kinase
MVGHDLRNPLQGISGATHILRNDSLTAGERNQMLQLIDDCVKYSDGIVKNLLDYSREIRLELASVSIKQVVKDALLAVNVPKKVEVLDQSETQLMLIADPNALKRVFVNLIDNAIDAMPEGGRLTITSEEQKDFVKISDTGIGLSKQAMENLWKPLRTTKAKGMGIGLAICKRLVEAHGGKIAVESKEGLGTTFIIRIPIK